MTSKEGDTYEAGREENPEAPADVDRLAAPGALAAIDRGDRYRILWECLAKKNKLSDVAQAGGLSSSKTMDFRPIFAE